MSMNNKQRIQIGVSSCLLGHKVRFDANHKEQRLLTEQLANQFDFVPICPEMAIGLGVPRTPIHLTGDLNQQRVVNVKDPSIDVTDQLVAFGEQKANELRSISGYIFKKGSPSCGLYKVKIYKSKNQVLRSGTGLFAQQIIKANPLLPVEEEGRLNDENLRNNFLQRVHIYHRWQQMVANGISKKKLLDFHTQHKFTLLAHCETTYRILGKRLAGIGAQDLEAFCEQYIALLMNGLKKPDTRSKHINVLQHIAGFFKKNLDKHDKHELSKLIETYRDGIMPREVLITMLRHYLRKFPNDYLDGQYYLRHPIPMPNAL